MYFSAACLIGMRPLFAKVPSWFTRKSHANSNQGWRSRIAQRTEVKLRPKNPSSGYRSRYAPMQGNEDVIISPLYQGGDCEIAVPFPVYRLGQYRDGGWSDSSEFRVETNMEVRWDQGYWQYMGNAGENTGEYAYYVPVYYK